MNFIKTIITITLLASLTVAGLWCKKEFFDPQKTEVQSLAPTLEKIQALSELVTNRVYISDILIAKNKDYKGQWAVNGDALISIDLNEATLQDINEETKTATLNLPQPKVISARVDQERTKAGNIEGIRLAILRNPNNRTKLIDGTMVEAQRLIEHAANKPDIINNSRQQAQLILENLYLKVGWKLNIAWQPKEASAP